MFRYELPKLTDFLDLYQRALTVGAVEYFQQQTKMKIRRGMYCVQVGAVGDDAAAIAHGRHAGGGGAVADPRTGYAVVAELPARAERTDLGPHRWLLPSSREV